MWRPSKNIGNGTKDKRQNILRTSKISQPFAISVQCESGYIFDQSKQLIELRLQATWQRKGGGRSTRHQVAQQQRNNDNNKYNVYYNNNDDIRFNGVEVNDNKMIIMIMHNYTMYDFNCEFEQ